jgi:2',3'-cyclic-nucleotide 2'-phosphodiesterase (5'-nucleotidase family)
VERRDRQMTRSTTHRLSRGLLVTLVAALTLALNLLWATEAYPKPASASDYAEIQLLSVNDFHGNLEPVSTGIRRCPTAGGAAYLDAYLDLYEQKNPDGRSGCTPATWSGALR